MENKSTPKRISNIIKNQKTTRLGTIRKPDGKLSESPTETLDAMITSHFDVPKDKPTVPAASGQASANAHTGNKDQDDTDVMDKLFSTERIKKALAEFDPMSAAGPDGIRPVMLQKGDDSVNMAFANIAKASYLNSHIPECWKNTTGIFLPKPGKDDYYNPKSYRTITLAPVPLKWMERLVLWHMEVDLNIYSKLSKRQYGFTRGASTETALHKVVHKIERAILNSGMALGTFLDIEGAFDNVAFDAIERALNKKCPSSTTNNWIMTMIKSRSTTVELNGIKRTIEVVKGCPQGGILSPFLWNLVVDSLLSYTKDTIPCDIQGFADDLSLIATLDSPRISGDKGFDAATLREITQKSLNAISAWCKENGLKISALKTHAVMFTWRKKWSFSAPLMVDNDEIKMELSTKFLGVYLDSKLTWNEHITKMCKKAKGILMLCRRAVGPTWGFTPKTMKWIYTAIVRPCLSYGAVVWINGINSKTNVSLLNSVQRLANVLITGALPSTPSVALDMITDIIPIRSWIEEEAIKGSLRLRANGHWLQVPMVNSKGNLTSHTKILDTAINSIHLSSMEQDNTTTTLNLDSNFMVEIPNRDDFKEVDNNDNNVICYTDGSKMDGDQCGAGIVVNIGTGSEVFEESFHLGVHSTVFQAEVFAISRVAHHLTHANIKDKTIVINCDSQAAIMALHSTKIRSKTTLEAVQSLSKLGRDNHILVRWIPAHQGFEGNERADTLAKKGANNQDATSFKLPIPSTAWNMAIRKRTYDSIKTNRTKNPPSHFKRVWRDKFKSALQILDRGNLRIATMFLTGHSTLNYHLNKYKPDKIPKTCPHCLLAEETTDHFIGHCPKWSATRSALFQSFYLSVDELVEHFSIFDILRFIRSTGRMKATTEWKVSPPSRG